MAIDREAYETYLIKRSKNALFENNQPFQEVQDVEYKAGSDPWMNQHPQK